MVVHRLYSFFDRDEPDMDRLSICVDCAKHPSLRKFVRENAKHEAVCGICQKTDTPYDVCDPARRSDLENLVKALVRFHFNEYDYNPHWGGEHEPARLLAENNPIVEHASSADRNRSNEQSADFLEDLFAADPYPPVDRGVSVYAGFSDGIRLMARAIKDEESELLGEIRASLATQNHFDIEAHLQALLEEVGAPIRATVPKGSLYHRARIGASGRYRSMEEGWERTIRTQPYEGRDLSAPPPLIARAGRLNRAGVSFLYLASDEPTAVAEVRPHPAHVVSVGQFRCERELRIASFDADIADYCSSERLLELFGFIHSANRAMATPVTPEEATSYSLTQLLADCLRQRGFEGVMFRSSIAEGSNLCVFRPDMFSYVNGSARAVRVTGLRYCITDEPTVLNPGFEDLKI